MQRLDADRAVERAARGKRPQHAKQQAVDMMMRHAREHRRVAEQCAPLRFERVHFGVELRERLADRLGRAAATRGVERERGVRVDWVDWRWRDAGAVDSRSATTRQIGVGQHGVVGVREIGEIARRRVGRNHRLLAACEQREQRAGEIERIVDTQRVASRGLRSRQRDKRRDARAKRRAIEHRSAIAADRRVHASASPAADNRSCNAIMPPPSAPHAAAPRDNAR